MADKCLQCGKPNPEFNGKRFCNLKCKIEFDHYVPSNPSDSKVKSILNLIRG